MAASDQLMNTGDTIQIRVIFSVIFLTNLMINMDHGILPAATEEMRRDFGVTNT